jgi:hypothetical protein
MSTTCDRGFRGCCPERTMSMALADYEHPVGTPTIIPTIHWTLCLPINASGLVGAFRPTASILVQFIGVLRVHRRRWLSDDAGSCCFGWRIWVSRTRSRCCDCFLAATATRTSRSCRCVTSLGGCTANSTGSGSGSHRPIGRGWPRCCARWRGGALRSLRLLVRPDTILRRHRGLIAGRHATMSRPRRRGRSRTLRSIRAVYCAWHARTPAGHIGECTASC